MHPNIANTTPPKQNRTSSSSNKCVCLIPINDAWSRSQSNADYEGGEARREGFGAIRIFTVFYIHKGSAVHILAAILLRTRKTVCI